MITTTIINFLYLYSNVRISVIFLVFSSIVMILFGYLLKNVFLSVYLKYTHIIQLIFHSTSVISFFILAKVYSLEGCQCLPLRTPYEALMDRLTPEQREIFDARLEAVNAIVDEEDRKIAYLDLLSETSNKNKPSPEELERLKAEAREETYSLIYDVEYAKHEIQKQVRIWALIHDWQNTLPDSKALKDPETLKGISKTLNTAYEEHKPFVQLVKPTPVVVNETSFSCDLPPAALYTEQEIDSICQSTVLYVFDFLEKNNVSVHADNDIFRTHIMDCLKKDPNMDSWLAKNKDDIISGNSSNITQAFSIAAHHYGKSSTVQHKTLSLVMAHICSSMVVINAEHVIGGVTTKTLSVDEMNSIYNMTFEKVRNG